MDKIILAFVAAVGAVALIAGASLLGAYLTLWTVNYLFAPAILMTLFGVGKLTFWKAFCLNFVCASLFKSTTTVNK